LASGWLPLSTMSSVSKLISSNFERIVLGLLVGPDRGDPTHGAMLASSEIAIINDQTHRCRRLLLAATGWPESILSSILLS
jgi:hypothetical protein